MNDDGRTRGGANEGIKACRLEDTKKRQSTVLTRWEWKRKGAEDRKFAFMLS